MASKALVTQAVDAQKPEASRKKGGKWFFGCFGSNKDKKPKQGNLSAVVPSEITQAPQKWEEPSATSSTSPAPKPLPVPEPKPKPKPEPQSQSQPQPEATLQPQPSPVAVTKEVAQVPADPPPKESKEESSSALAALVTQAPAEEKAAPATSSSSSSSSKHGPCKSIQQQQAASSHRSEPPQLGPQVGPNIGRKTLVLDLDETLVHSSFRSVHNADIVISVEIEGEHHKVYVRKRPGCDEFLLRVAQLYEVVVYTASMSKYASPLLDKLDKADTCHHRLYREACTRMSAGYAKDLSKLGRDLKQVIIIDNSPICYSLQPDNAIPIQTWRDDMQDRELLDLIPILISLAEVEDIPQVLRQIIWAGDDEAVDENG